MTQDEIIEMARQAGFSIADGIVTGGVTDVEAFAKLVAAKQSSLCYIQEQIAVKLACANAIYREREACALRAEDFLTEPEPDWDGNFWNQAVERVAMAIRARGEA
jgi:hypothetical protein